MRRIYFDTNKKSEFIKRFPEILKSVSGKSLIISLIQENRELEDVLDVLDMIIYDNSDYISNIIDFDKAILELDDENYLLPSSYKMKNTDFDFELLNKDIESFLDEEIKNIFILFDDNLKIDNKPDTIKIVDENSEEANNVIIIGKNHNIDKFSNIRGFLNDDEDDFNELIENIINDNYIIKKEKKGILEKIKGLFSRNG
ncbi:hypothetical protein GUI37_03400 [Helcococcus kunzii]|uniref:hypothetical protein n=1 Tax=Helcococcus kunzii TaxID=40091 RepID=UPI001BAE5694|nr:hypothetical protein [Helcococcus kunzii]QUY64599.1 hypothetical protein GUI37_03400 [Helcococcus kunzii]